jgi:hypothetical protein
MALHRSRPTATLHNLTRQCRHDLDIPHNKVMALQVQHMVVGMELRRNKWRLMVTM